MEQSMSELNSMMQSVSKTIGHYDLTPQPLYTGHNSQIFHITNHKDGRPLALKVIYRGISGKKKEQIKISYMKQVSIHQSLTSRKFIVKLQNSFKDENHYYIVLEYCPGGNLRSLMKHPLGEEEIKRIGLQIGRGIQYLHRLKIIHCDIKPENILIAEDGQAKIGDFGESLRFGEKRSDNMRGELTYAPPEAIERVNQHRDTWAFACLLYEMAKGKAPFAVTSWKELSSTLTPAYLKQFAYPASLSPPLKHLLSSIFTHDEAARPRIEQILTHPFFTGKQLPPTFNPIIQPIKSKQSSKSKPSLRKDVARSIQIKSHNKQNRSTVNIIQSKKPDYKKILEGKFREDTIRSGSSRVSRKDGKGQQSRKIQDRREVISPLNTKGMVIKQLMLKKSMILVCKEGFVKRGENYQIRISCDGRKIQFMKNGERCSYLFDELPTKYLEKYIEAKKIVKEIMKETARMSYKDQEMEVTLMFSGDVNVKFTNGIEFKQLSLDKILKNTIHLQPNQASILQKVTLSLLNIHGK